MTPLDLALKKVIEKVRKEGSHCILASSQKEVWGIKSAFRDFKRREEGTEGISIYTKRPPSAGGKWLVEFKESTTLKALQASLEDGEGGEKPADQEDMIARLFAEIDAAAEEVKKKEGSS